MLRKLYIKNFALIENLEIEFGQGFNVLTGETGAGKSIIIDAVGIITGQTAQADFIRSGEEKALLEAVFEHNGNALALAKLSEFGFIPDVGEDLILTRELNRSGKNLCRINGRQVNLSLYKEIAESFVDIYGQHHQQSLLNPQKHIELLDCFGGDQVSALKNKIADRFNQMRELKNKIQKLRESEKEMARMADIYKFQFEEIENASVDPGEDGSLEESRRILGNAEKISHLSNQVYEAIYEGGAYKSAVDLLYAALSDLKELNLIDPALGNVYTVVEEAMFQLEEAAREIKAYTSGIEHDPDRLEEIENRLELIKKLKKKYGDSIEDILQFKAQIAASLDAHVNHDQEVNRLEKAFAEQQELFYENAVRLRETRIQLAQKVTDKITQSLKELNMPYVTLEISIKEKAAPASDGIDQVEFLISPNKGEPLKPLAKIVSGGEMSRIMLAFKSILAGYDHISTLIFDEVDAGIGGSALNAVAAKLSAIGQNKQVISVTHSPQLAGHANTHFSIRKTVEKDRTVTTVYPLSYQERVNEIARMLSGDKITETTRIHAEEILKYSLQ